MSTERQIDPAAAKRAARLRRLHERQGIAQKRRVKQIIREVVDEWLARREQELSNTSNIIERLMEGMPPLDSLFYTPSPSELEEMMPVVDIEGLEAFLNVPLPLDLIADVRSRQNDGQKK